MRRSSLAVMVIGLSVVAASAQQPVNSSVLLDMGGTRLSDERLGNQTDQRPIGQEDRTLRTGRELKQGGAIVVIRPREQKVASSPRVRSRALLQEDRSRVKREAALVP